MAGETEGSLEDQEEMMPVGGQSQAEETKWQQNQVKKGMEYMRSLCGIEKTFQPWISDGLQVIFPLSLIKRFVQKAECT